MADSSTGTVTFLFTDIQGSTAMWERDAKRMQAVLARHDEIMKTTVSSHGGYVFKMIGDACCAAFKPTSVVDHNDPAVRPWSPRPKVVEGATL